MNLYKNHTDREVMAVLDESAKLTYDAQLNLLREIKARRISVSTEELEGAIKKTETAINDLAYLKDLGFKYQENLVTKGSTVLRATLAKFMDVVALSIGLVLFVAGLIYFWMLMDVFFGDSEFTLGALFIAVLAIAGGLIGFKMLSGVHRFLDYYHFYLTQSGSSIILNKGGLEKEQKMEAQALHLQEEEGELILYAATIEVMRCTKDNLVHKKTLEALMQKMMENR